MAIGLLYPDTRARESHGILGNGRPAVPESGVYRDQTVPRVPLRAALHPECRVPTRASQRLHRHAKCAAPLAPRSKTWDRKGPPGGHFYPT